MSDDIPKVPIGSGTIGPRARVLNLSMGPPKTAKRKPVKRHKIIKTKNANTEPANKVNKHYVTGPRATVRSTAGKYIKKPTYVEKPLEDPETPTILILSPQDNYFKDVREFDQPEFELEYDES